MSWETCTKETQGVRSLLGPPPLRDGWSPNSGKRPQAEQHHRLRQSPLHQWDTSQVEPPPSPNPARALVKSRLAACEHQTKCAPASVGNTRLGSSNKVLHHSVTVCHGGDQLHRSTGEIPLLQSARWLILTNSPTPTITCYPTTFQRWNYCQQLAIFSAILHEKKKRSTRPKLWARFIFALVSLYKRACYKWPLRLTLNLSWGSAQIAEISSHSRSSITSETAETDGESVMGVVRLRQSHTPVNFCAISGSKSALFETCCSSANEGLIFPGLHIKPLMASFTLQCDAGFRCTFASPGARARPGSGAFQSQALRTVGGHH